MPTMSWQVNYATDIAAAANPIDANLEVLGELHGQYVPLGI